MSATPLLQGQRFRDSVSVNPYLGATAPSQSSKERMMKNLKLFTIMTMMITLAATTIAEKDTASTPSLPQNEEEVIDGWIQHGFWASIKYEGYLKEKNFHIQQFSEEEYEELLKNVDITLNPRYGFEEVLNALHREKNTLIEYAKQYPRAEYKGRDEVVSRILGFRLGKGKSVPSMRYVSQQFKNQNAVEKAYQKVAKDGVSVRFLVARFISDIRLMKKMLEEEKNEQVLLMLALRTSKHVADQGKGHRELKRLIQHAFLLNIRSLMLARTFALFSENDFALLMTVKGAILEEKPSWSRKIILHRLISKEK